MYTVRFYDKSGPGLDTFLACKTYDEAENKVKKELAAVGKRWVQDGRYCFRSAYGQPAIAEIKPGEMTILAKKPIAMSVASNGILYRIVADGEYTVEITQLDPKQFAMVIVPTGVSGALITEESISGSLIEAIWDAEDTIAELKTIPEVEQAEPASELLTDAQIGILKFMAQVPTRHLWTSRVDDPDWLYWFDVDGNKMRNIQGVIKGDEVALLAMNLIGWSNPGFTPGYYITGKGIEYLKGLGQ